MDKRVALQRLEYAFWDWYDAIGAPAPDFGIVVIGLSSDGLDMQYIGKEPNQVIDWPGLFTQMLQEFQAGRFTVDNEAAVPFERQQ